MPTPDRFAKAMEALGVGEGTRVVLYDRRFTMWATRVWWMLKVLDLMIARSLTGAGSHGDQGFPVDTAQRPLDLKPSFKSLPELDTSPISQEWKKL